MRLSVFAEAFLVSGFLIAAYGLEDPKMVGFDADLEFPLFARVPDDLPDDWEKAKFGHTRWANNDDPDHDGFSNYLEYRLGTNPNDAASKPIYGTNYQYDSKGRVVKAIKISGKLLVYETTYEYDVKGNRTKTTTTSWKPR